MGAAFPSFSSVQWKPHFLQRANKDLIDTDIVKASTKFSLFSPR